MSHLNKRRRDTRLEIICYAAKCFAESGYSATSIKSIAQGLDISPGNITFYFPSKDHLLYVLVELLLDFQQMLMDNAVVGEDHEMLSYCLEITSMAALCAESEKSRDFYVSIYSSPMTMELVRQADTEKTRRIFADLHPEWGDIEWRATENIVSGIEYSAITANEEIIPLDKQVEMTLNSIMMLYGVPENIRRKRIDEVFAIEYRELGKSILAEFRAYLETLSVEDLKTISAEN